MEGTFLNRFQHEWNSGIESARMLLGGEKSFNDSDELVELFYRRYN